jgi:TetR/AcrR family transcriptional repressor of uid operon
MPSMAFRTGRAGKGGQTSHDRLREAAKALFAKHGYEATSTAAICRAAGTSQSQLIKHFTSKQGLLEAIFQHAWEQLNPAIRLAIEKAPSPKEKLRIFTDIVLTYLEKDPDLRTLFLLEGRRIRGDGDFIVLVPGYLDFVRLLDGILKEMASKRQLASGIHPQALRSALIGAVEGMLRDRLLARPSRFPASYSEPDIRRIFSALLSALSAR